MSHKINPPEGVGESGAMRSTWRDKQGHGAKAIHRVARMAYENPSFQEQLPTWLRTRLGHNPHLDIDSAELIEVSWCAAD